MRATRSSVAANDAGLLIFKSHSDRCRVSIRRHDSAQSRRRHPEMSGWEASVDGLKLELCERFEKRGQGISSGHGSRIVSSVVPVSSQKLP